MPLALVSETANETLESYYKDVIDPVRKDKNLRCFGFMPEPANEEMPFDMPFPLGAPGVRAFTRYCLARLNSFTFNTQVSELGYTFEVRFQTNSQIPDPKYVAWAILRHKPTPTEPKGVFVIMYDPARVMSACSNAWCQEKCLMRLLLHECFHAISHTGTYIRGDLNATSSPQQEVEAHEFALQVMADIVGKYAEWSRVKYGYDAAWRM